MPNVFLPSRRIFVGICIIALFLGLFIRIKNLSSLHPIDLDERSWLLLGTSLLSKGVPSSWTIYWNTYEHLEGLEYGGRTETVVTPYLDHPPLFGLGMGLWATLTDNNTSEPLNWATLRLPMIALALGTIVMTWLFLHRLFNPTFAALTAVAFAFFPSHIIASRFIAPEHAIAFLLVSSLYAFAVIDTPRGKTSHRTVAMATIVTICSLAIFLKLSAIVIPATLGLLALLRKNTTVFLGVAGATLISIFLFLAYGAYYDWGLFLEVLGGHTGRPQSFWHFWSIVTQMDLGYFSLRDPSIIIGFVGLFTLLANRSIPWRKRLYIFVPLLNFSVLFLFIAPVESYGWYKYVLFPLLAIGLGYAATQLVRGRVIYFILFLPLFALLLEHAALPATQGARKGVLLLAYALVVGAIIFKRYFPQARLLPVSAALLAVIFFLELAWVGALLVPNAS